MPLAGVAVVALFENDQLPTALAKLHGAGYGAMARVLDAGRGDIHLQLQRLGIDSDLSMSYVGGSKRMLVVQASGRSEIVGDLLLSAGASDVRIVRRGDPGEASPDHGNTDSMSDQEAGESA